MYEVGTRVRFVEPEGHCNYLFMDDTPKVGDMGVVTGHVGHYTIVRLDDPSKAEFVPLTYEQRYHGWKFLSDWLEPIGGE